MATKAQAKARKAAWQLALQEGRVVRSPDGLALTAYRTVADAMLAIEQIRANGFNAEIVKV